MSHSMNGLGSNKFSALVMPWPEASLKAYLELLQVNYLRMEEKDLFGQSSRECQAEYNKMAQRLLHILYTGENPVIVMEGGRKVLYNFKEFFVMISSVNTSQLTWWPTHFESLDAFLDFAVDTIYPDSDGGMNSGVASAT